MLFILWLLCSVFKVRFRLLSKPDSNTQSPKCLNPLSKVHFWDPSMMGRGRSRAQAFWHRQNLAAGGIHFRRGCQILLGGPHLMQALNGVVGPSGLEPPTSRLSVVRSSQLSYGPISRLSSFAPAGPISDGTRGVPRPSVLALPNPCHRRNSFPPRMSNPLWGPHLMRASNGVVEINGFEPLTPCLQSRCSPS